MPDPAHAPIPTDPEMAELVEYFLSQLPARIASLEKAAGDRDAKGLQTLAHQLKGAAPGYGFPSIGEAARALEQALRTADDSGDALDRVRPEFDALVAVCRSYADQR